MCTAKPVCSTDSECSALNVEIHMCDLKCAATQRGDTVGTFYKNMCVLYLSL